VVTMPVPTGSPTPGITMGMALVASIAAPAGTPPDIVARLNKEMGAALAQAAVRERFDSIGLSAAEVGSPKDFKALLRNDFTTSRKLLAHPKLKAD